MGEVIGKKGRKLPGTLGYRGRSAAHAYVRDNFDWLVENGVGTADGPSWGEFAAFLASEGILNAASRPISKGSARKIFERAKKDVEAAILEARTGLRKRQRYPSQMPANWAPIPIQPSSLPSRNPVIDKVTEHIRPGESRPRTGAEKVAALRQKLAERSGM